MSRVNAGLAGLHSLSHSMSPMAVGRTMEQFNRVAQQEQQQQIFKNLLQRHQSDVQNDPEYRKHFNNVAKRNPNALMSAQDLSETRGTIGAIRENLKMLGELEQRVGAFGQTPQGQAIGFNAEFKRQELKRIAKVIQENPEVGNQMLLQEMNILSAAMQNGQAESMIQQFFRETDGKALPEQLALLDQAEQVPFAVKQRIQNFLLQRNSGLTRSSGDESGGFKELMAGSSNVSDEQGLANFKEVSSELLRRRAVTAKEKEAADTAAEKNFKQVREFEGEVKTQQDFANNVDSLVTRMKERGFEPTEQGLSQFIEDDEENAKFFKAQTGFETVGEARRGLDNFDQIIQDRFQESLNVESTNEELQQQFEELGGETKSQGKPIAVPSTTIRGALTIPTKDSNVAVYENVPPDDRLEPGGFFKFAFDEKGLPGVVGMNLVAAELPDDQGGKVRTMLPSFEAIETRSSKAGDQIAFHFPDSRSEPRIVLLPVAGGAIDQANAQVFNLKEYARDASKNVDPNEEANRADLLLKSIESFRDGVEAEVNKASGKKKERLLDVFANTTSLIHTTSTMEDILGGLGTGRVSRKVKSRERGTVDENDLVTTALMRYYIEYARFNAVMTNTFTDEDDSPEP